jgi:phospholipid/cholesterol/gamma-HCH transport system permease protein
MSKSEHMLVGGNLGTDANARPGDWLGRIGRWSLSQVRGVVQFFSIAAAVAHQSLRPLTWRRTVRNEFFKQCHQIGVCALPFILITGSLVGFGIVYQAIYWLTIFEQSESTGFILVLVLVREVGVLFVVLTVIGRSATTMLVEIGNMQIDGQIRMLDAQGIDPFLFLIVPRVAAVMVCMFSLTVVFITVALVSGFLAGLALDSTGLTLQQFATEILSEMGLADFAIIPLKTMTIGIVVALIACTTGLSVTGSRSDLLTELPRGVTKSVLAALLISILLTLLL